MLKLGPAESDVVIKALKRIGFRHVIQKGSHIIVNYLDDRCTMIPIHPGERIERRLLMEAMSDVIIGK